MAFHNLCEKIRAEIYEELNQQELFSKEEFDREVSDIKHDVIYHTVEHIYLGQHADILTSISKIEYYTQTYIDENGAGVFKGMNKHDINRLVIYSAVDKVVNVDYNEFQNLKYEN